MGKEQNKFKYERWILKSVEWVRGKKVRLGPSFISAAKDVVGGSNG